MSNKVFEMMISNMEIYYPNEFKELDWVCISSYRFLSDEFIERYNKYLVWNVILLHQNLTEFIIRKHIDKINFKTLLCSKYKALSIDFLYEYKSIMTKTEFRTKSKLLSKKGSISYFYWCFSHNFEHQKHRTGIIDDNLITLSLTEIEKNMFYNCRCCESHKECPF